MDSESNGRYQKMPIQVSIGGDVMGLGVMAKYLIHSILVLIKWRSSGPKREILNERERLRNEALRIRNAAQKAKLAREFGYSPDEMKSLFRSLLP
ncbi:MAG: hypothetical protein QOE77_2498 [Blastocatellia bacterium]|jgi:hypothetical protein|nr:hypothetical protein [Blastocatellia bacterium]